MRSARRGHSWRSCWLRSWRRPRQPSRAREDTPMSKIQQTHLARTAYVYIRQSTMTQVHQNVESQRRQYALVERAKQLGWDTVQVIDTDLGRSGSGQVQRDGFDDLVADVCQ